MPYRRFISLSLKSKTFKIQRGRFVKYNFFLTKNGLKVTKTIKKSRSFVGKANIFLNIFSKSEEKVLNMKVKSHLKSNFCEMSKKCDEDPLSMRMQRMSIDCGKTRKLEELDDHNIRKKPKVQ